MTINLGVPHTAGITASDPVIGVGGAGCNAVNNRSTPRRCGISDWQYRWTVMAHSMAPERSVGHQLTGSLSAGSKPEWATGREESLDEVLAELADSHMVSSQPVWAAAQVQVQPL